MSSSKTNRYSAEFKDEAVKLAHKKGASKAARDLGVSDSTIYKWISEAKVQQPNTHQATTTVDNNHVLLEENKRLRKELARVKEEREILKKATSFFASLED